MATVAPRRWVVAPDARFYVLSALLMWLVLFVGFGLSYTLGRSSFASPWIVHLHAAVFVGWVALYLVQTGLAATLSLAWHRRLGWLAAGWIPLMVVLGTAITISSIRRDTAPFFFTPGYFLVMDPLAVLTFAGLSGAGIALRRRTQWHRRLMLSGMAMLTGPGWGRFAPVPLLLPYTGVALTGLVLLFPLAGVIRDWRRHGTVHPAWWVGIAAIVAFELASEAIPHTALGHALYDLAAAGSPAAGKSPLAYPPFPSGFPVNHP